MKRNSGIAFHCHHDRLYRYVYDYKERVEYIKKEKPREEQELRLRLFKLIPLAKLPLPLKKAIADCQKAYVDCQKVATDCQKAAYADWREAYADWRKADAKWKKVYTDCYPKMKRLHKELCPNCPWDGKTIFPKEGK